MIWNFIARICAKPQVRAWLINRAMKTPFSHIVDQDGVAYMRRYWLFNRKWKWSWLPAMRIHHIRMPDDDRAKHDHPFDYRSFILDGWYTEEDLMGESHFHHAGSTYFARAERFHQITAVSYGGVFTLVICYGKMQPWGYLKWTTKEEMYERDIRAPLKVHHRDYDSGMRLDRSEENLGV